MTARLPPGLQLEKVDDRIMTLNVGPQHPGSGHMRLIIQVDGDRIVSCDPDPGYVHRGVEELLGLEVSERAKYVRVIASELNRFTYTLYWLAIYGIFLGHSTMFMW